MLRIAVGPIRLLAVLLSLGLTWPSPGGAAIRPVTLRRA
jgi:hypothetical protein